MVDIASYGFWKSTIEPISTCSPGSANTVSCRETFGARSELTSYRGVPYWTAARSDGTATIYSSALSDNSDWDGYLPEGFSAKSRVHEYGGGSYVVTERKGNTVILFVNASDQAIYQCTLRAGEGAAEGQPQRVSKVGPRWTDMTLVSCLDSIVAIGELHAEDGAVENFVGLVDMVTGEWKRIASGNDFYATPRVFGTSLAFVSWNHPNMPWDQTSLMRMDLNQLDDPPVVVDEGSSILYPLWSPGGTLYYVSDKTGYWNVTTQGKPVLEAPLEFCLPMWVHGSYRFVFLDESRIACSYLQENVDHLAVLNVTTGDLEQVAVGGSGFSRLCSSDDHQSIFLCLSYAEKPPALVRLNVVGSGDVEVIAGVQESRIEDELISVAQSVSFESGGTTVHAYYYPPKNPRFKAPEGELPPCILRSHGGPTSRCNGNFNRLNQYFTSRGFSILDVNYRGSCGHGRVFRNLLKSNWGVFDLEDMQAASQFLVDTERADKCKLFIQGSSAGGYTTLAALTFSQVFAGGSSRYGISDLTMLARDTHKFEARYLDSLVGPYPESEQVYKARSPLFHSDLIATPCLFLHGSEDRVVPVNQAELFHQSLLDKKIQTKLVIFDGEGHGFRAAQNIITAAEEELHFFQSLLPKEDK